MFAQQRVLVTVLAFVCSLRAVAQERATPVDIGYKTETNILDRDGDNLTEYMTKRCRLDVYYPTEKSAAPFPTVVWFHGGGYLTSMIGLDKRWLAEHEIDADKIAGLIPYSGHTITHFTIRSERGIDGKQPILDDMAPLYHVRADAPPLLLITGDRELEMLGRYEENAYMWRMMKVAGHEKSTLYELAGFNHGGMSEPAHPLMLQFVRQITKSR